MAIDLASLRKKPDGGPAKAGLPHVPADTPIEKQADVVVPTTKPHNEKPKISNQKPGMFYFYSEKPNFGFFLDSGKRVKFQGNYYETDDKRIADYILQHYGKRVVEITEEQKIDGTSL